MAKRERFSSVGKIYLGLMLLGVAVLLGAASCGGGGSGDQFPCDLPEPFCGGSFPLNTEPTTPYGPAWADVILSGDDWISCFGRYALCYYATCTPASDEKVATCPCFDTFGTYYVDINAILNLDVYNATKSFCAASPELCQTPNEAPVCASINSGEFLEGAERFSTFSYYRAKEEPIGCTNCTGGPDSHCTDDPEGSGGPGLYAGCMTAPCFGPVMTDPDTGTAMIDCDCPTWDGPFQFGKNFVQCDIAPMVYSAAYTPSGSPESPCDIIPGCIPDAPMDSSCACPLFVPGVTKLPVGSDVDCDTVCEEYENCTRADGIELGFTCDATLCTTTTTEEDRDLILDACLGLEQCDLSEVFKAERVAECSCCASQLCGCEPNGETNAKITQLNDEQRAAGGIPQCDRNWTLCGLPTEQRTIPAGS